MMAINDPLSLIRFFTGSDGATSSTNAKDLNYLQDFLSYLMSPDTGVGTETYDPLLTVPPQYVSPGTPVLDSFETGSTPIWASVARRIRAGQINPAGAVAEVAKDLGFQYDDEIKNGMSLVDVRKYVDEMFKELKDEQNAQAAYAKSVQEFEQNNFYGKAGLPQPTEQYSVDTLPYSERSAAYRALADKQQAEIDRLKFDKQREVTASIDGFIPEPNPDTPRYEVGDWVWNPTGKKGELQYVLSGKKVGPNDTGFGKPKPMLADIAQYGLGQEIAKQMNNSDTAKTVNAKQAILADMLKRADLMRQGEVLAASLSNKTPLSDALAKRAMGL
jgi:hypothetical protein